MTCVFHKGEDALFQCYRCHNPICVDCESKADGNSICPRCRAEMEQQVAAQYQEEVRDLNYTGAVFAGFLAALIAAIAWSQLAVSFGSRTDLVAVALGALVGYAVAQGAGDKRGRDLQQIAALIALAGILTGYFLVSLRTAWSSHLALSGTNSAVQGALYAFPVYLASIGVLGWLLLVSGIAAAYWVPHVRTPPGGQP
jgi:phosphate/sulfate permease